MVNSPSLDNLHIEIWSKLSDSLMVALPSILLGLFFVVCAFVAVWLGKRIIRKMQFGDQARQRVLQAWAEVETYVQNGDDVHLRMAVIQADAVLDMALQAKSFPGRTLNDRLNFAIHKYRNLKKVRWAHGLRNTLAHEPIKPLSRRDGMGAISSFRAALKELGAL